MILKLDTREVATICAALACYASKRRGEAAVERSQEAAIEFVAAGHDTAAARADDLLYRIEHDAASGG